MPGFSLNCRRTSATIWNAVFPTARIAKAANAYGKRPPINNAIIMFISIRLILSIGI